MKRRAVTTSRRALIAAAAAAALVPSSLLAAGAPAPGDVQLSGLTVNGVEFPAVAVAPNGQITVTVSLSGDVPQATYVTVRSSGVAPLQRAATGQWVAWDGRQESLVDNRLPMTGGKFVVPINVVDLASQKFPAVIFIGYRTVGGIKFGIFNLLTKQ